MPGGCAFAQAETESVGSQSAQSPSVSEPTTKTIQAAGKVVWAACAAKAGSSVGGREGSLMLGESARACAGQSSRPQQRPRYEFDMTADFMQINASSLIKMMHGFQEFRKLAGEPGFEPGLTESESVGLPLTYSPAGAAAAKRMTVAPAFI